MKSLNRNWELAIAQPADADGMQKVFEDGEFQGSISVKFSRSPDPFQSFQNDGEHIVFPIVRDCKTQEILGVGGCVIRPGYVNGKLQNTAYLTGLKIMQKHQKSINCIIPAYKLLREQTVAYNPFYYTTILKSNEMAIKLLEKRRKSMPPYIFIGEYTVFCLGTGYRPRHNDYILYQGHSEKLRQFYQEELPKYNLSPQNEWLFGLKNEDFYYLQAPDGKILAACALWNQQNYKQYIISGYRGIYKLLSYLPINILGYPTMPKAGESANYASIAMLIIREENLEIANLFVKLVLYEAKKYDFVMLGCLDNHPLMDTAQKLRHIKYKSRLYAVDYSGDEYKASDTLSSGLDNRPIMLEVGLL